MTLRRIALLVCGIVAAAIVSGPAGAATPYTSWAVRGYDTMLSNVTFLDRSTGFAVGDGGTIMRTTDAGHTWFLQNSGVNTFLSDVHFASPSVGYVVGAYGKILKTTDGSWSQIASIPSGGLLTGLSFPDPGTGWASGYGIYETVNGGFTWTAEAPPVRINAVEVTAAGGWAVGGSGLVLQRVQ